MYFTYNPIGNPIRKTSSLMTWKWHYFPIIWIITNEGRLVNYSSQILLVSNKNFAIYSTINTCLAREKLPPPRIFFRLSSTPMFVSIFFKTFLYCACLSHLRSKCSVASTFRDLWHGCNADFGEAKQVNKLYFGYPKWAS